MIFDPQVNQEIIIDGVKYHFAEHPSAPHMPFGQSGRAATVYKLDSSDGSRAFKVFFDRFRSPSLVSLTDKLSRFAAIPGLSVCQRSVLTPQKHASILRPAPDLTYAVLMPWIEGPTWLQVLQEKQELSLEQSLSLAKEFATLLANMEQQGIAHCDLSNANLLLPALARKQKSKPRCLVELVDVEQIYAEILTRPILVPSGSGGYGHKSLTDGIWDEKADRFAGAILLAEILGWADPAIRGVAQGESFFDPNELQERSPRFDRLQSSLEMHWGKEPARLLERAWCSDLLSDCPTFGEWLLALPDSVPEIEGDKQKPTPINADSSKAENVDPLVNKLLADAEKLATQGNKAAALEIYNRALALVPPEGATARAVHSLINIHQLETNTLGQPIVLDVNKTTVCPHCEKLVLDGEDTCPYCGKKISQITGNESQERSWFSRNRVLVSVIALSIVLGGILLALLVTKGFNSAVLSQQATPTQGKATEVAIVPLLTSTREQPTIQEPTATSTMITPTVEIATFTPAPAELQLTFENGNDVQPFVSPDGEKIVFTSSRDGNQEIYIMNSDGTNSKRLTNTPNLAEDLPSFSPDGKKIIYGASSAYGEDIYLMNIDGSDVMNITDTADSREARPRFMSGNPMAVVFDAAPQGQTWNVYTGVISNNKLTEQKRITTKSGYVYRLPSFIPQLNAILFRREANGQGGLSSRVVLHDLASGDEKEISGDHPSYYPQASPDGKWIFFVSTKDGKNKLFQISTKDFSMSQLPVDYTEIQGMIVSPDNQWLVVSARRNVHTALFRIPLPQ